MSKILEVEDLRKTFGGITAVDGATFDVEEGTVTGLIGPNGAGKTTTFNLISGFYEPDSGSVRVNGVDTQDMMTASKGERAIWSGSAAIGVGGAGVAVGATMALGTAATMGLGALGAIGGVGLYYGQERAKSDVLDHKHKRPFMLVREGGLVRTFQITRELQGMTVLENLMLAPPEQDGEHLGKTWFSRNAVKEREAEVLDRAREIIELLEIEHLEQEEAGNLSGGQRKLLELGRVLMTDPEIILLDEPVAGVNPTLTRKLLDRIDDLRSQGYTFLIVEHDMEVIMNLSDTIIVMSEGKKLMEGTPEEVQTDERVIDAYLGG